ncbi:heat-shock related protein [Scheffersomyces stipitis CBS 6054]|uniref:Heat-shock related protein n=1 Tax=Scheffersomyces stipitis (strain ATCC 58785 / CBS 6054 / NBRC 10063 / NRRL Y-11545) TaxID=322104 RepID=A3LNQ6_PICST|nr:heat-shock related protein [Scheffersomyces stipitis CBS 6054]ABN64368.2 heat-shock related protein [Scheffersomyces stipitis CBS 6054]KAG2736486.1 hypothetical protein G9P44_000576 [Scheffersomyces stipitis]
MSKKSSDPPVKKNAFVHKLYSMLNDPKLTHLIWWSENNANSFALYPGKEFANSLTRYFKHGNVASFVRQLHMYGFHKVSDPTQSSTSIASSGENADADSDQPPPVWEFKHSSGKFKKGEEASLIYIKRRPSSNSSRNSNFNGVPNHPHPQHMHPHHLHHQMVHPHLHTGHIHPGIPHESYSIQGQIQGPYDSPYATLPAGTPMVHGSPMVAYSGQFYPRPGGLPLPQPKSLQEQNQPLSAPPQPVFMSQSYPHPVHYGYSYAERQNNPSFRHSESSATYSVAHDESHSSPSVVSRHQSDPNVRPALAKIGSGSIPVQAQHYAPNLQFRKIWETNPTNQPTTAITAQNGTSSPSASTPVLDNRPRNPSLLYDPLVPVSPPTDHHRSPSYLPLSRNNSNTASFSRDSVDSRSSIKLPPPSSLHSVSGSVSNSVSVSKYPQSPEPPRQQSPAPAPLPFHQHLPRSIPSNFEASPQQVSVPQQHSSLPGSPVVANGVKKPSLIPVSNGIHERLRPSLLELHFGSSNGSNSAKGSSSSAPRHPQDSIGSSTSSHNSVFSTQSSLSSVSSSVVQRASSFGSISHNPLIHKNSFSISPHDTPPISSSGAVEASVSSYNATASSDHRSSTSSPLSKSVEDVNKKVSVRSLLGDSSATSVASESEDSESKRRRLR